MANDLSFPLSAKLAFGCPPSREALLLPRATSQSSARGAEPCTHGRCRTTQLNNMFMDNKPFRVTMNQTERSSTVA